MSARACVCVSAWTAAAAWCIHKKPYPPTDQPTKPLQERLRRLDQSDPAAVLAMTEQVLEVLNLPAPTLPPHVVEVAAPPGMMHVVEAVRG